MKRIMFVALAAMLGFTSQVSAQITEGEPTAHKIRTGNRMEKGNWGLYMGVTSDMFKNWKDASIKNDISLPLLNVKYMASDKLELRIGVQALKNRETLKGSIATAYDTDGSIDKADDFKNKNLKAQARFTPGFAYHFSKHNILDVYAGAEMPLGWSREKWVDNDEDTDRSLRHGTFDIGLGGFVGLQAFIGHLPLALGVEYGLSSITHCGNKYVQKVDGKDALGNKVDYTYKFRNDPRTVTGQTPYKSLKNRGTELGSQFRITLSYYFK
ncbi:MAG: hypothetical protein IJ064_01135 [Bacteroidaceae bacterium]|nr:hypothetical protein [Bacteroidaceae bacterium]